MKTKFTHWLAVTTIFLGMVQSVRAQDSITLYLTTEQLPDLIVCMPAPPDTIGADFAHDIMRYMWGKTQRLDPERAAMARRDAVWSYEALLAEMSVPFGIKLSPEKTPEIWKLLVNSLATTDQMRVTPKSFYHRKRPYERFNEHMLTIEDEDALRGEGSYPSGHTMRGWTAALLLAEVNPAAANEIYKRGWQYCESRVIVGAHWQSDVDVTRVAASVGYAALQTSYAFREQVERAKAEFARLALSR